MSPKIAIIGAGPGGLTLASILIRNGISPTVFEHDAFPEARTQGGSLDLHPGTGQEALAACGLTPQFEKYARYGDQDFTLGDKYGNRVMEIKDKDVGRPEIDRGQLRQILLDSIPKGVIKWNHHLVAATEDSLQFRDHIEVGWDLIVGADGAWSKIRPLCCYVTPYYTGISAFRMMLTQASTKHAALSELVGKGTYYSLGEDDGLALAYQRMDNDMISVYAFGRRPEDWIQKSGIDVNDHNAIRAALKKDYTHWDPKLCAVFDECEDNISFQSLYMLPVGLRWPAHKKMALIGDAAHLMTPFAGEGVNLAMTDALDLANAIISKPNDIAAAIAEFQPRMWERAKIAGEVAWENAMARFEPGALVRSKRRFQRRLESQGNLQLLELADRKNNEHISILLEHV
ncbi:zeaxanthin epoxidase, putative [Talaromyces stipitatus ATCC 10500]|uniref:Zeaxanthin epoxidase, putative n=1 Tax=Talaromyces stipitatus (strain ATCC 10500 / CBS 375.48 / QM 6759 / NRRL 1006) TaxID=441959 RepID=B8M659_TALSN|nr:zeaxanthin epoxidase, putative [Talaromyces stipitatus ATCC 10500]EED19059.1 zeaxanthin epoxidase, putative [Talaromyces stipitatus ATCC 10500]